MLRRKNQPNYTVIQRAQALTLFSAGHKFDEIERLTGVKKRSVQDIKKKTITRGYDPTTEPLNLTLEHLADAPRSGRPLKLNIEQQEQVIKFVEKDRQG